MNEYCYVKLSGVVTKEVTEVVNSDNYSIYGTELEFERLSNKIDKAILNIKGNTASDITVGGTICVDGTLRTYKTANGKSRTVVLVYNIDKDYSDKNVNSVDLQGRLHSIRMTKNSSGVDVCEARIEVVSGYSKMSRITAVGWGVTASKLSEMESGTRLKITGRLQSRCMRDSDDSVEALEIAIKTLDIIDKDTEGGDEKWEKSEAL